MKSLAEFALRTAHAPTFFRPFSRTLDRSPTPSGSAKRMTQARAALAIAATVSLSVLTSEPAVAQAVITIDLRYSEIHDRILPFQEQTVTSVSVEAHILAGGAIQQSEARESGHRNPHSLLNNRSLKLGGSNERQRWRVVGRDKLLNVADYESYRRGILLTIVNQDCTAQVNYQLKPGFTDYRYHRLATGEPAVATAVRAENLVCTVH